MTTTFIEMLNNPQHANYKHGYVLFDNTVYTKWYPYTSLVRNWLLDNGIDYKDKLYRPVAKIDEGQYIGWFLDKVNPSTWFLSMPESDRTIHYSNLYWVDNGLNPYPKQTRRQLRNSWQEYSFHKECHKLLLPSSDPKQFFKTESQIIPQ